MSRKHVVVLATLVILIMALSLFGCQGYQAPEYKSPDDAEDEELEEVEIDVSDLGEEELEDDFWEEEDLEEEFEEEDFYEEETPVVEPEPEVKSYTPVEYGDEEEEEDEFKKSPYRPIVEEDLPTLTVTEGELVKLSVKATDADGDELSYEFTAPLNSEGKWQTRSGDTGVYYTDVTVSDGKTDVVKRIKIVVEPKNNKPVLQFIPNVEVNEGETVTLSPRATDADGDKLSYSYAGWMSGSTKETDYRDSGVHKVTVSVTDGISTVSQEVTVTVNDINRPPEVEIEF
jgi:hypothetical protein